MDAGQTLALPTPVQMILSLRGSPSPRWLLLLSLPDVQVGNVDCVREAGGCLSKHSDNFLAIIVRESASRAARGRLAIAILMTTCL